MSDASSKPRRSSRPILFVIIATVVPTLLGAVLVAGLLIHQERLVITWKPFSARLQTPPKYVEEPGAERTGHRYLFDDELGWRNIPNWEAQTGGRHLKINSKGLRDREYPHEKPPGTKRILVLGDSYVWGYGVGNNERFTDFLEIQLGREDINCEVLNSGVSGYGTDQEYLWFRSEGVKYQPDLVILAFFVLNDPMNNVSAVQYGLSKPLFLDTNLTQIQPPVFDSETLVSNTHEKADQLAMSIALIKAISDKCNEIGSRFVLMKFGFHGEKESQLALAFDRNLATAVAEQMPTARLLDLDAECGKRELSFFKMVEGNIDGHWNAWGHKQVAEILFDYILPRRKELLGEN